MDMSVMLINLKHIDNFKVDIIILYDVISISSHEYLKDKIK